MKYEYFGSKYTARPHAEIYRKGISYEFIHRSRVRHGDNWGNFYQSKEKLYRIPDTLVLLLGYLK